MKTKLFLIAAGLGLAIAGAASACTNASICGSGWQSRGGYDRYGGGASYGCGSYSCNGGSNYNSGYNRASNYNSNYNNNYNNNYNQNKNTAYGGSAQQSQGQGQGQEQSQQVNNSGNNTAQVSNSGNSTNTLDNSANNSSQNTANVNVAYTNIQKQQPVATAYAAPLVAGVDTCMGSTSVGGQGITIGFSAATTWSDKNCIRLKNSRELNAMGMSVVACELLQQDREVAEAFRRSGMNCGVFLQPQVAVAPPPPPPPAYEPPPQPPVFYEKAGERG